MGVSTAMYAAITGMKTMGEAMSVISNNIANVNTVGFKASRANFQDLLSQKTQAAGGGAQVGRGVQLGSVTEIFSQGSFQNSAQDTDIAISGEGFFQVIDQVTGESFYTRAGNFIFDKEGALVTPNGARLQGWALNEQGGHDGDVDDITMDRLQETHNRTSQVSVIANLDADAESRTDDAALSSTWRGIDNVNLPVDGGDYVYQTSLRVYDTLGGPHDLSVYFDPDDEVENVWEYMVCCDPEEDGRQYFADTEWAGLLQRGEITFNPTDPVTGNGGSIRNITAATLLSGASSANISGFSSAAIGGGYTAWSGSATASGTYTGLTNQTYYFRAVTSGYVDTDPATSGVTLQWSTSAGGPWSSANQFTVTDPDTPIAVPNGEGLRITFGAIPSKVAVNASFSVGPTTPNWVAGTPNEDGYFEFTAAFRDDPGPPPPGSPAQGTPVEQVIAMNFGAKNPFGLSTWDSDDQATTQYAAPSSTIFQTQDGYGAGYLQRITIDDDGIITGSYSNGVQKSTHQIALWTVPNQWGMDKIGRNLWIQTNDSGVPRHNAPGVGGAGVISPNSLEQSNVDLADEFVDMIVQQRGFQANSKIITTTDTMLNDVINMKR